MSEAPWQDEETLRELYHEQGLTQVDVAHELGCSKDTVLNWFKKLGISARSPSPERTAPVPLKTIGDIEKGGYENLVDPETKKSVRVHQLMAIADGADPYKIFSSRAYNVHHKNGFSWDNRYENIELLTTSEHVERHWEERGGEWRDEDVLRGLYEDRRMSTREVAAELGCDDETVRFWLHRFDVEVRTGGDAYE